MSATHRLYYNAFTENLFTWNNDLEGDIDRKLLFNTNSHFFDGLRDLVDIEEVRQELEKIENDIKDAKARHNEFLKELGLNLLP